MTTSYFATEIFSQLGGHKFLAMTGCKNLVKDEEAKTLTMGLVRNQSGAKWMKVTLDPTDTYTVEFIKGTAGFPTVSKTTGVYAEMLQGIFTKITGLQTRL